VTAPRLIVPLLAAALGVFGGYTLMHSVGPNVGGGSGTKDSAGVVIDDSSGPPPERTASNPRCLLLRLTPKRRDPMGTRFCRRSCSRRARNSYWAPASLLKVTGACW